MGFDGVDVGVDYYYHIIANHRVTGAERETSRSIGGAEDEASWIIKKE